MQFFTSNAKTVLQSNLQLVLHRKAELLNTKLPGETIMLDRASHIARPLFILVALSAFASIASAATAGASQQGLHPENDTLTFGYHRGYEVTVTVPIPKGTCSEAWYVEGFKGTYARTWNGEGVNAHSAMKGATLRDEYDVGEVLRQQVGPGTAYLPPAGRPATCYASSWSAGQDAGREAAQKAIEAALQPPAENQPATDLQRFEEARRRLNLPDFDALSFTGPESADSL